ncbi:MAG: DUF3570 domain-containing protein [Gammaproteobacteria bacterium]|nr:DUF3570 domain-containing protein [Gammaproteobacteria bacterium]
MRKLDKRDEQAISTALATATCALLGTSIPAAVQADEGEGWDFNTSVLYYGEDENRVQDLSISAIGLRTFVDDRILSLGITLDSLTGATPSGAIRQDVVQTFTRPSGSSPYDVAAGTLPLDDTFKDTRVALTANWQQPFGETSQFNVGGSLSKEYDYLHLGVNAKLARDFNKRNTTVSAGLAFAHDELDPVGGAPTGFSPMLDVGDISNRTGKQDKQIIDLVVGVSQVVSRNIVMQANYSYSYADGYLTDPYKILSVVDPVSGDTIARTALPGIDGPSHVYLFEHRPDERTKHSFYVQTKYFMEGKVLDASYRYMTDDWDIDSHTVDLRYRWPVGASSYLEPHLRFYTQTEAEFYTVSLADGATLPTHASADFRLGNFDAITAGLKYGWKTRNDNDMSVRLEWYAQSGSVPAAQLIGNQASRDNYPDLNAVIVQFGYRF